MTGDYGTLGFQLSFQPVFCWLWCIPVPSHCCYRKTD